MTGTWRERLLRLAGREEGLASVRRLAGPCPTESLPVFRRPLLTPLGPPRAASLCVASGKGGTGKSVVAASLACQLADRGRTLILDADFGVGNAHILQDVAPTATLVDVALGQATVRDALVPCSGRIDLLGAGSGVPRMAELSKYEVHLIASGLEQVETDYRYLLVDSAAGISRQTLRFALACDQVLVVTTPDLTAMTDAYALLKVLHAERPELVPFLLVNRAQDATEAGHVAERILDVARRFLSAPPVFVGWCPEDPVVARCVNRRGAVALLEPGSPFAASLRPIGARMVEELASVHPRGAGRTLVSEVDDQAHLA